ncbi:lipopolysaccharide biosynthesis protein [Dysgonomonas sp. 511]|uniref:lipopolysaccharide biosynthesis protein n=1 Tax=Dysgonomonas sp. 511 TaxID=2302930 RepID=UPI0013D32ED7|nr:lipopolysaccharide biosynthesis protein [Dysgonomonas sp. 511]NDV77459.1 lipopolysaccharide biosynthesis protein [Dysgonomonas sp. 511]
MSQPLKRKTGLALFWSFVDKGGQQVIQFVFFYILARLVLKEDFGIVGILAVFTAVANILQESGFSSALIRKKRVLQEEYTSVFYFNIIVSLSIYIVFFACAPLISQFYGKPILTNLSRVIFLSFVFSSFGIVQNVHLIREMNFKTNTRITLLAGVLSGAIAITMAYNGMGVWSLVMQLVFQNFLRSTFLWIFVGWRPAMIKNFVFGHIKEMSPYSLKLLATALLNQICNNIAPLIIGKKFDFTQVASYSQGVKLNTIPQSIISDGIKSVAYPLLTNIDGGEEEEKKVFRKVVRIAAFISFPVAMMLIVLADPIVSIYLPPEWKDVIPLVQILAIGSAFYPFYVLIGSLLQFKGKSGLLLNIEIIRNTFLLSAIVFCLSYGVTALVVGVSAVGLLSFLCGIYIAGRTISYTLKEVITDIAPYMVIAGAAFLPTLLLHQTGLENKYLLFFIPLITGSCLYLLIVKLFGSVILEETINFVKQSFKRTNAGE